MLTYDDLANLGLSQGNLSWRMFWYTNFRVGNIQFPTHHEKLAKTSKKQSTVTKKFNLIKVTTDCCDPDDTQPHTMDWVILHW